MKVSNRLIAGLGVLMVSASALVHAAPQDQNGSNDDRGPGQHQDQGAQGGAPGNSQGGEQGRPQGNAKGNSLGGQQSGPQGESQGNRGNDRGNNQANNRGNEQRGGHPPQDFGDVRRTIQEHREVIGRGQPLPPGVNVVKGQPLPRGYGRRLDARSQQYLPRYDGYEWRRLGPDVALVAIGSGIVYEILDGVLN